MRRSKPKASVKAARSIKVVCRLLVSSSSDEDDFRKPGELILWNVKQHKATLRRKLTAPQATGYMSLAISSDGRLLATGCGGGLVKLWDIRKGQPLGAVQSHGFYVAAVAFSPDGNTVAATGDGHDCYLFDVKTGRKWAVLSANSDEFCDARRSLAFSPDSKLVAAGGDDKTIKVWDLSGFVK